MVEDLGEELVVELAELTECVLDGGAVVSVDQMEELAEAVGGVVQQLLGVLQAIAVVGEAALNEVRVLVDLPEGCRGVVGVVCSELCGGLHGEAVDQLGVEEALLAWLGLGGAVFEAVEGFGSGDGFVGGGARGQGEKEQTQRGDGSNRRVRLMSYLANRAITFWGRA